MTANPTNTCKHLEVGEHIHEAPFFDMMDRQLTLQARLGKIPPPSISWTERAHNVIYWRHCAQTECDELIEWFDCHGDCEIVELEMEAVDVLHFVFNIGIALDVSPSQLQLMLADFDWHATPREFVNEGYCCGAIVTFSGYLTKLIDCLPWKTWKNYSGYSPDKDKITAAYAELVKSALLIGGNVGMDKNRLYNVYVAKNNENHARQDRNY